MTPTIDLENTYLFAEGAELLRVSAAELWPRLMTGAGGGPAEERVANGAGWLIGVFRYAATWDSWEMHPEADEVVHVTSGRIELVLEQEGRSLHVELGAGMTAVVPKGAWHTAIVHEPGEAIHVTFGRGTEHRAIAT